MLISLFINTEHSYRMGNKNGKFELSEEDIEAFVNSSGKSADEIKNAFNIFKDEHPNGKINKKDFSKIMKEALPKKYAKSMQNHVFSVYDTNNDGVIDFQVGSFNLNPISDKSEITLQYFTCLSSNFLMPYSCIYFLIFFIIFVIFRNF